MHTLHTIHTHIDTTNTHNCIPFISVTLPASEEQTQIAAVGLGHTTRTVAA